MLSSEGAAGIVQGLFGAVFDIPAQAGPGAVLEVACEGPSQKMRPSHPRAIPQARGLTTASASWRIVCSFTGVLIEVRPLCCIRKTRRRGQIH